MPSSADLRRFFYVITALSPSGQLAQGSNWIDAGPHTTRQTIAQQALRRLIENGAPHDAKTTFFALFPNELAAGALYYAQISVTGLTRLDAYPLDTTVRGDGRLTAEDVFRELRQRAIAAFRAPSVVTGFHLGPDLLLAN